MEAIMENIIRIVGIDVKNIKNVRHGKLATNSNFGNMKSADIIGFYGQNGSGKTAMVEAFSILKRLFTIEKLPDSSEFLMMSGQNFIELYIEFIIKNRFGEYSAKYSCRFGSKDENLFVENESIAYKENLPKKKYKELISKANDAIEIRKQSLKKIPEDIRVKVMLANEMSELNQTGFIFRNELRKPMNTLLTEEEFEILKNLAEDFNKDFHVIDNVDNGLILSNILMPFSIHLKNWRGKLPYTLKDTMLLDLESFEAIKRVINQINVVLENIIPGLQISARAIYQETLESGDEGVRFELLSCKNGIKLPLRCESAGVLKLISILSTLIAVYNNPNACVVIDELDSGVFEYLLGEILEVIHDHGKGQLFFTSHNLRVLEVLNHKSLWFTTLNENNRFIQLKGVKNLSNVRDIYLRAVQLGGQDEELYRETNAYDIKKAFRMAGGSND